VSVLPRTTRLPNGITLLTRATSHNDIVAIRAVFRSGARIDPLSQMGVAPLTFSLMLKDTRTRSSAEVAEFLEETGGSIGEEVRKDLAAINVISTSEGLGAAMEVLSDAVRKPAFLQHRIDIERHNLLMSIREEEDSPLTATFKLFQKELYGRHPYARPTRGEPETVAALGEGQVLECHARHVRPDRLIAAVVGNFEENRLVSEWDRFLGDWVVNGTTEPIPGTEIVPAGEPRTATRIRAGEGTWAVLGYLAPPMGHPDYVSMKVLDCILGGSADSRLFAEVRDRRGLAYMVGTTYPERQEPSIFAAFWGTSPEQADSALGAVTREFDRVRAEIPAEEEVERAKRYLRGIYLIGQETNSGQASLFSFFESMGLGIQYAEQYPEALLAVTPDDVRRVAERYLTVATLAVTKPG